MKDYTQQSAGRNGFSQPKDYIFKNNILSPADSRIYYVLLSYYNKELENNIFPGQYRIAREANVSKSTVIRSLKKLKKLGLINWKRRGQGITNSYSLNTESELLLINSIDLAAEIKKEIEKMQKCDSHQVRSVTAALLEVSQRHSNNTKYNNTKSLGNFEKIQNSGVSDEKRECHEGIQNVDSDTISINGNNPNMVTTLSDEDEDEVEISDYLGGLRSDYDVADESNASPINVVNFFLTEYESRHGKPHPNIVTERLEECLESISCFNDDMRVEPADWENMVRRFFVDFRNRPETAQRLELFCNPEILMNRWQEECY